MSFGTIPFNSGSLIRNTAASIADRFDNTGIVLTPSAGEEGSAGEPEVVYVNGQFRMFYSGGTSNVRIRTATSYDGRTWTKQATPVVGGGNGGQSGVAARPTIYYEAGTYYLYYCDLDFVGGDLSHGTGNIWLATSTDGISFTRIGIKFAETGFGSDYGWASGAMVKSGSTYIMLLEGWRQDLHTWVTWYFTANSPDGPWSIQNGGEPILTMNIANGLNLDSASPGFLWFSDEWWHQLYHCGGFVDGLNSKTQIYYAQSQDLITWTRAQVAVPVDAYDSSGNVAEQLADCTGVQVNGVAYLWYTRVDLQTESDICLSTFSGGLTRLGKAPGDAQSIGGTIMAPVVPTSPNQVLTCVPSSPFETAENSLSLHARWTPVDSWDAGAHIPPIGTVTITGTLSPDATGDYVWQPEFNRFRKDVSNALWYDYDNSRWNLFGSGQNWHSSGTSTINPAGSYTPVTGATGTATVTFAPATVTQRGVYQSQGDPNYIAPVGSLHVRTLNGAVGRTLFVNETGTENWSKVNTTPC